MKDFLTMFSKGFYQIQIRFVQPEILAFYCSFKQMACFGFLIAIPVAGSKCIVSFDVILICYSMVKSQIEDIMTPLSIVMYTFQGYTFGKNHYLGYFGVLHGLGMMGRQREHLQQSSNALLHC